MHFDDIHVLLAASELDDIVVHEERARRILWKQSTEDLPEPSLSLGMNLGKNRLRFRFRMVMVDESAEYVADFEAVYSVADQDEITVTEEIQSEFSQRVAFMAVYPFLRASIFGSASRLGTPRPVLPMVRQGDMGPGERLTEDEVRAAFFDNRSELAK